MTYNATNSTHLEFELSGKGDWIAVGFSNDRFMVGCLTGQIVCHTRGQWSGGRVTQQRFIWRRASALKSNLYNALLYTFLTENGTPSLPLIDKQCPFHISFLERCIPFYFRKCNAFKVLINPKTKMFSRLFLQPSVRTCGPFYRPKS